MYEVAEIAGNFALAFYVHGIICSIVSLSAKPEKNVKNIRISYLIVSFLFIYVGIMGSIGLVGNEGENGLEEKKTIFDFLNSNEIFPFILSILFSF